MRKTTESFVESARKIHGDKYSYERVSYVCSKDKVIITCKIHGDFLQIASNHLSGSGCGLCAHAFTAKIIALTPEEFIARANKIHNFKYGYGKLDYTSRQKKVLITCPIHGDFRQSANGHLLGMGCVLCGRDRLSKLNVFTTQQFIEKAEKRHDGKYSYEKVDYTHSNIKVTISCPRHGDFTQQPKHHLSGKGCPACGEKGFDSTAPAFIYVLSVEGATCSFTGYGITGDIEKRLKQHELGLKSYGYYISDIYYIPVDGAIARLIENKIAKEFPRFPQEVVGFKREATKSSFISVKDFVEKCLKECIACE